MNSLQGHKDHVFAHIAQCHLPHEHPVSSIACDDKGALIGESTISKGILRDKNPDIKTEGNNPARMAADAFRASARPARSITR